MAENNIRDYFKQEAISFGIKMVEGARRKERKERLYKEYARVYDAREALAFKGDVPYLLGSDPQREQKLDRLTKRMIELSEELSSLAA